MLAFTDESFARLVRAARGVSWRKRSAWLREIAAKLDPPRAIRAGKEQARICPGIRPSPTPRLSHSG
jgi:hypothetical protein